MIVNPYQPVVIHSDWIFGLVFREAGRPTFLILLKQPGFQPTAEPNGFQPLVVQLSPVFPGDTIW